MKRAPRWIVYVVAVLVLNFPVIVTLVTSFKSGGELSVNPGLWVNQPTFDNYLKVLTVSDRLNIYGYLGNSLVASLIGSLLAIALTFPAAYAVARLDFPGKKFVVGASLMIAMFPQIALVTPLFKILTGIGLFDTWLGLIIPYITFALPLAIYTLSAFFREIPWELEKAAKMDGATPYQAFRKVIAPLAMPGVFTTAILVFISCWNDFLFAISLTSSERSRTVPAALSYFTGATTFEKPTQSIAAAAVVITIPIVIFVLFFQRRIVAGLTSGAVKG